MRGAIALQLEAGVDTAAASFFAAALAFSGSRLIPGAFAPACAAALAALGFVLCRKALNRVAPGREHYAVPIFDVREIEPLEALPRDELLLTESDRLQPAADSDPLVLDDVLAGTAPDSRVVQLFDPAAMPTAGQLKARIDRHLDGGTSHFPSPDASEALFEALADLRRSLR
jgi:hypothetical protein